MVSGVRNKLIALISALTACVLALGAMPASSEVPNLEWTALLPPLPTAKNPQPGPVSTCKTPRPGCIRAQIRRLRAARDRYGCDHRAVFATTYLMLTKQIFEDVKSGLVERDFIDPEYLYVEDAVFNNVYQRTLKAWADGREVADAWRISFKTAERDDTGAVQDMLLGINAHVQNDMPFVLASLGLRTPDGRSRKPDHDEGNGSLNRGYEDVVEEVRARFDSAIGLTNPAGLPADDLLGLELVRTWRENVWRNAERLLNADSDRERRQVAKDIEDKAAATARLIAAGGIPGYGETRDAYCAAGPSGS